MNDRLRWLGGLVGLLGAAATLAQPPADSGERAVGLTLTATVEQLAAGAGDGAPRLVPFTAEPGAAIVYTVAFANVSGRTLEDVRITNALPEELAYVANSASGPGSRALFSADGGRTFHPAAELEVSADQYTHVRWLLPAPLDPGSRGFVRFRANLKPGSESEPRLQPAADFGSVR